jgi:rubrerythrin
MLEQPASSRRSLIGFTSLGVLSVAAVGLLGGSPAMAAAGGASQGDIDILNVALGLENEAIEAYQIGAESGLLTKPVLAVAVVFQGQHKGHRDALIAAVQKLGGTPVQAKSRAEYLASLNAASIKSQTDILRLAQKLEKGAANAYIGVMPSFQNKDFAQVCGRLAADEATHWALLSQALGDPYPTNAFIFG